MFLLQIIIEMKFLEYYKRTIRGAKYAFFAKHRHGHGIHSPFVFDFITTILDGKEEDVTFLEINEIRTNMLSSNESISYTDPGAGSMMRPGMSRKVSDIARYSSTPHKYGRILYRMVKKYKPNTIVELGTSLGLGTLYLSAANKDGITYTMEGAVPLSQIAESNFNKLKKKNIKLIKGLFETSLPKLLNEIERIDFVFIDGNHSFDATWNYFNLCLEKSGNDSTFVFDDIHWSDEMEQVWKEIKKSPEVRVTIDLFQMGIVFFKKELSKQNFVIRY